MHILRDPSAANRIANPSPLTKPDPPVLIKADPANARQLAGKGVKGTVE